MCVHKEMTDLDRLQKTIIPSGRISMVLDTDAYNEIDDQFAILYALLSPDRIDLQAVYAALYYNQRSNSPEDGMELSYQEICKILKFLEKNPDGFAFRGCKNPIKDRSSPESSEAVEDLILRARARTSDNPLYVVGIGACTNLANAILLAPDILEKVVAVWLVGNSYDWHDHSEFNLSQDQLAAAIIFDSGVPLIQVPAHGVTGFLITSIYELEACIGNANPICDYLIENVRLYETDHFAWGKPIWDVGVIGMLVNNDWVKMKTVPSPFFTEAGLYSHYSHRHLIRCVSSMNRDKIFKDMFHKLRNCK